MSKALPAQGLAILALLNRLVDRLDGAELRGSSSAQTVALGERIWPELYRSDFESEKAEHWGRLQELMRLGWVQVTPEAAARSRAGYAVNPQPRIRVIDAAAVRAAVGRLERAKSSAELWKDAVYLGLNAPAHVLAKVSAYCIELPGHAMTDTVERLNGLRALGSQPLLLREVSSKLFWGMSKVLDGRQDLVAAVLELDECPFPAAPVQLLIHLPEEPVRGVLLIENHMTFEQAVRSSAPSLEGLAILFAAGFKASAARLRRAEGSSLFYSRTSSLDGSARDCLESWLYGKGSTMPEYFWGDLDWAGMQILAALRSSFPRIQAWAPGYGPMLTALQDGHGHEPKAAEKAGQRPLDATGCAYADMNLLPALRVTGRFVDQEVVSLSNAGAD